MLEIKGSLWSYRTCGYLVIPTNGLIKNNGFAVMGRGLALQCANPSTPNASEVG